MLEFWYTGETDYSIGEQCYMENLNELLYMIHMNDEYALKELLELLEPGYDAEIGRMVKSYPTFGNYKAEMRQEMRSTLHIAIETFRYDIDCTFRSYAMIIARRKLYRLIVVMNHQFVPGFNRTASLEAPLHNNREEFTSLFASRDVLSFPEYVLDMNEAGRRLDDTVNQMPKQIRRIYDAWCAGYQYKTGSERLGLTYKQYESSIMKVKRMVHQAVMA